MKSDAARSYPHTQGSDTLVSVCAGAVLGAAFAVVGPLAVAFLLNHDPVHRGPYVEISQLLLATLPAVGGAIAGLVVHARPIARWKLRSLWFSAAALVPVGVGILMVW